MIYLRRSYVEYEFDKYYILLVVAQFIAPMHR